MCKHTPANSVFSNPAYNIVSVLSIWTDILSHARTSQGKVAFLLLLVIFKWHWRLDKVQAYGPSRVSMPKETILSWNKCSPDCDHWPDWSTGGGDTGWQQWFASATLSAWPWRCPQWQTSSCAWNRRHSGPCWWSQCCWTALPPDLHQLVWTTKQKVCWSEQQNKKHIRVADLVHGHTTYLFLWRPSSTKSG